MENTLYINHIQINKLFHLQGIDIPLGDKEHPHLILTGKNGSGKTILLNAIAEYLEKVKGDTNFYIPKYRSWLADWERQMNEATDAETKATAAIRVSLHKKRVEDMFGKVELTFTNMPDIVQRYNQGEFLLAFYQANRKVQMSEPKNPVKPTLEKRQDIKQTSTEQFLNFLVDLKFREALAARDEKHFKTAEEIRAWFVGFEHLLQQIFQEPELKLDFDIVDYSFRMQTADKSFKFNEMSDGFAAVLDIVVDLILKMQNPHAPVGVYLLPGIVLIDEIETHLHLELQKLVLPLLTRIFPNIQFIVTTHSPFVLSSLDSAVAFDLEHREAITDLTDYSYESLSEGYFGVTSESSYATGQLDELENLLQKERWTDADRTTLRLIIDDFEKISEALSPLLVGRFRDLKNRYSEKLGKLGV